MSTPFRTLGNKNVRAGSRRFLRESYRLNLANDQRARAFDLLDKWFRIAE